MRRRGARLKESLLAMERQVPAEPRKGELAMKEHAPSANGHCKSTESNSESGHDVLHEPNVMFNDRRTRR